ncbi:MULTISPECIES: hypothetical protein [Rhodococcus]|uniref:Uncharacterized protein n=1 Tax=Rhodococcus ruber BKS 20-38 TaxID=1278076 RepID=M2YUU0_9NOCA|nr:MULTISPECIES: hypothetical protein [Rhodococcus]EME65720.1 hypothetical protein G352_08422 [Rhodococcus ruber BKS 20-38]
MTEKKSRDEDDEPKGGRPGPVDEGKDGGMATRENAPEIAENSPGD